MNMPIADDNTVHFTSTLMALIRTALEIKLTSGMVAQRLSDAELKRELSIVWPSLSQKTMDLLVTPHKPNELTEKDLPMMLNSVDPPSMLLQTQSRGSAATTSSTSRPNALGVRPGPGLSTLTNGGALSGHEVDAQESSSWLAERTKDAPRGRGKHTLSKGQSDDTPDTTPQESVELRKIESSAGSKGPVAYPETLAPVTLAPGALGPGAPSSGLQSQGRAVSMPRLNAELQHRHAPPEKQRYYSCDRYCGRDHCHARSANASCATSPSETHEAGFSKQGSSWVRGSLATLSSTSSTPSRGRRQLPQTPPTPRPSVAYKTTSGSSPVHLASGPSSLSPGRLTRGVSEHHALRHSVSSYRHVPCPVTRISSEPFLGQGCGYEPLLGPGQGGYCYGHPRSASPCGSLQDGSSSSPGSLAPGPFPGARPPDYSGPPLPPSPRHSLRVPNGYPFGFPSSGGPRAPRYYQEVEEDEWC
ncbi:hypothetical protein NHX12_028278 [Muraenolepis orangiensis]|uniref:Voltage-dependent calcium channel alpha-1 subunit IQ domain-containing protein n=1 Tax=Muraenolepis orangiensis TaxID=630683 RepID=A0A9Q0EBV5_9TELE|nr:hypothetical protein NHX12_028278 [Muraenolepis orangiensis]